LPSEAQKLSSGLTGVIKTELAKTNVKIKDWSYVRKNVGNISERFIYKKLRRRPLVMPVVIEV
jgi:mRNA degradation ribonuclease J1/J2